MHKYFVHLPVQLNKKFYARKSRGRSPHSPMNAVAKIVEECLGTGFSWGNSDNKTPKSSLEILREGFTAWGTRQHTPRYFLSK